MNIAVQELAAPKAAVPCSIPPTIKLSTTPFKANSVEPIITGQKILKNYERYLPDISDTQTWVAVFFILIGIGILLLIDHYGKKSENNA